MKIQLKIKSEIDKNQTIVHNVKFRIHFQQFL